MRGSGGKEEDILEEYFYLPLCSFLSCTSVSEQSYSSRHHELRTKVTNEAQPRAEPGGNSNKLCHTPVIQGEMSNHVQDPFRKSCQDEQEAVLETHTTCVQTYTCNVGLRLIQGRTIRDRLTQNKV